MFFQDIVLFFTISVNTQPYLMNYQRLRFRHYIRNIKRSITADINFKSYRFLENTHSVSLIRIFNIEIRNSNASTLLLCILTNQKNPQSFHIVAI